MKLTFTDTKSWYSKISSLLLIGLLCLISCGDGSPPLDPGSVADSSAEIVVRPGEGQVDARVVSTEVIPQNNCGGSSTVTNSIDRSLAVIHTIEMGGGLQVSAGGGVGVPGIGEVDIGAAVSAQYGQSFGSQSSLSRGMQVSAREGTFMEHTIQIKELWQVGEVEIRGGDQVRVYPFKFRNDMSIELIKSESLGCDPDALATRAAKAPPTLTPIPANTSAPPPPASPTEDTSARQIPTLEPTPTKTPLPGFARFLNAWGSRGSGIAQFDEITGLAVDSKGDLYVADQGNGRIQKFSPSGEYLGEIRPDQGTLVSEKFSVAVDGADNLYFVERERDGGLVRFSPDGRLQGTIDPLSNRGEGYRGDGLRSAAFGPSGKIYMTYHESYGSDYLVVSEADGSIITRLQLPDYRDGVGSISFEHLDVAADETIYLQSTNCCLFPASLTRGLMEPWTRETVEMPAEDTGSRRSFQPRDAAIGPDGSIYLVHLDGEFVDMISSDGSWISELDLRSIAGDSFDAYHIALSEQGVIYIADWGSRIVAFQLTQ